MLSGAFDALPLIGKAEGAAVVDDGFGVLDSNNDEGNPLPAVAAGFDSVAATPPNDEEVFDVPKRDLVEVAVPSGSFETGGSRAGSLGVTAGLVLGSSVAGLAIAPPKSELVNGALGFAASPPNKEVVGSGAVCSPTDGAGSDVKLLPNKGVGVGNSTVGVSGAFAGAGGASGVLGGSTGGMTSGATGFGAGAGETKRVGVGTGGAAGSGAGTVMSGGGFAGSSGFRERGASVGGGAAGGASIRRIFFSSGGAAAAGRG